MSDKNDALEKYKKVVYPPLEAPATITHEAESYEAVKETKRAIRFRIVDEDGVSYGCSYAHLISWIFTPPALLTLYTASHIFTMEGKNLAKIERLLMDEKVRELHAFNPKIHQAPPKEEAIIEKLTIEGQG